MLSAKPRVRHEALPALQVRRRRPRSHTPPCGFRSTRRIMGRGFDVASGRQDTWTSIKRWCNSTGACTPVAQWNSSGKSSAHASIVLASVSRIAGSEEMMTSLKASRNSYTPVIFGSSVMIAFHASSAQPTFIVGPPSHTSLGSRRSKKAGPGKKSSGSLT